MNLFGTVLTNTAPSANYRGESAENRSIIQKITLGRLQYAIISPEATRNAIRETLKALGLPTNRRRVEDADQLTVHFKSLPDADKYADDFFMGWLIAANDEDKKKITEALKKAGRNPEDFHFKRDSVFRVNLAVALEPYRYDAVFTQSPAHTADSPWKNADSSQLLHRETTYTAFQYPFALNLKDCTGKEDWTRKLLQAIGQLNNVAGNHARSYFEMAPASIVVRLTERLVAGYDTYGFRIGEDGKHTLPEIVDGILHGDYPGKEFYLGGRVVKDADSDTFAALEKAGCHLNRSPQALLEEVASAAFAAATA